jgi:hypothetical protein
MANPANLTVNDLVVNADVLQGAGDAIDTNGTVPILAADLGGATGRLIFSVTEDNVRALTVTVLHGDNPPAVQQGLGTLTVAVAQNTTKLIGPLDSSRFMQNDGTVQVTFTGTGGAATCHVRAYLLPKV